MSLKTKIKYPVGLQWKIPEARLQKFRSSIGACLISAKRAIAGTGVEYYFSIYPNGDQYRGHTEFCFHIFYKERQKIEAEYTFSIKSAGVSKNFPINFTESKGHGMKLCSTEEFFDPKNRYVFDSEMVINISGFLLIEKDVPVKSNQLSGETDSFYVTLRNQQTKDFTIVADGREITAHKIILSARSPVFQAMFQPHTQEAQENKVIIPDFCFDVVEMAIKLCYHHSLVTNISLKDMILLLQFFDKYDIETLKEKVEEYLISELNESNVCTLVNGAVLSNAPKLLKKCSEFLEKCLRVQKPVTDLDVLDKDFIIDLFKNAFNPIV